MREKNPEDLLVKNLAEAIQKALKNSKTVRKAIEAIENEGHECILSFSAAIVLNDGDYDEDFIDSDEISQDETEDNDGIKNKEEVFEFDEKDIVFLKSNNISPQ
jgi:hypothetical protein